MNWWKTAAQIQTIASSAAERGRSVYDYEANVSTKGLLIDPQPEEVVKQAIRNVGMRGIYHDGHTYWYPANEAIMHAWMAKKIGITTGDWTGLYLDRIGWGGKYRLSLKHDAGNDPPNWAEYQRAVADHNAKRQQGQPNVPAGVGQ